MRGRTALAAALIALLAGAPALRAAEKKAPVPADIQTLVRKGKRPPFFDPKNLARPPVLSAQAALLMDFDSGEILYEVNAHQRRYPASTTKILTALLLIENVPPDDTIQCRDAFIEQVGESSLHVKPGEKFTAQDLTYGFLLRSGNDAGVLIAEHVGGSVPGFVRRMNERAREIGATESHFVNPHGLHDPRHYTTAYDLAQIARTAMQNPRFADAVRLPRRTIQRSIRRSDRVIIARSKRLFYDKFPGADGIKTGYTRPAGHCFVGSATRAGRRLIAVVLGATRSACADTIPLLSWGFRRFPAVSAAQAGQTVGEAPVTGGSAGRVRAVAARALRVASDTVSGEGVQLRFAPRSLRAPVAAGQEIGEVVAVRGGKEIARSPALAAAAVAARTPPSPSRTAWLALGFGGVGALFLVGYRHGILPGRTHSPPKSARRRRRRVPKTR